MIARTMAIAREGLRTTLAVLWIGALSAGCAAEPPLSTGVAARAPRHGDVYQQFCEQVWSLSHANSAMAIRGADGWELVGFFNGVICYKRAHAGAAAAPERAPSQVPVIRDPGF